MNSSTKNARLIAQRLPLIPSRLPTTRSNVHLDEPSRQAGDLFWRCGVEVAKVVYIRIDARYPDRLNDSRIRVVHAQKMDEAKKILNENRNEILEQVLPLFRVTLRDKGEELEEADQHAHDYFVLNLFKVMTDTFLAWTDEFVAAEEVEVTKKVIANVSELQAKRLGQLLMNFRFEFRPIASPPPEKS